MAETLLQPLTWNVPIVDLKTGNPTPVLIQLLQNLIVVEGLSVSSGAVGIADGGVTNAKLAGMASLTIKANKEAVLGPPEDLSLSQVLDFITGAAQGDVLFRGAAAWQRLPIDTAGKVLTSGGAGADLTWTTPSAGAVWWAGFKPLVADLPTAYTIPSSGGTALTITDDADVGLILNPGAFASGENYRARLKNTPAAGADWTLAVRIIPNGWFGNNNFVGIWLLENDATGKNVFFGMQCNGASSFFIVRRQSGQTTGTFVGTTATQATIIAPFWLRVRYVFASTTYFFDWSFDGKAWLNLTSLAETTAFTVRPTKMGLGWYINLASATAKAIASCDYFRVT
jgi:hypothetical protein